MTADQAARQYPVCRDSDAEFAARRQDSVLNPSRDQRIFDLQIAYRMHRRGTANRLHPDFGEADVTDVASLHHLGDRTDRFLDRYLRIEPHGTLNINMF